MNIIQRFKNIFLGAMMITLAILLLFMGEEAFVFIILVIGITLFFYGFKMIWYYFSMARHMVGGKSCLYQSILILDFGLYTFTMLPMSDYTVMFYLLAVFAFTGVIDVLRAFEAKGVGASWKVKFTIGCISILLALAMLIIGIIIGFSDILIYGYSASLIIAGTAQIINAFRKTKLVYIQ